MEEDKTYREKVEELISGLHNINSCPADNKIPEFMVESSCVEFFFDIVVVFFTKIVLDYEEIPRMIALIGEHITVLVIETTYVAKQYYYLRDGCNGADKCCDQDFLKFALGSVISEWLLVVFVMVASIHICYKK